MVPAGVTAPASKNLTSLLEPGTPLGVQLPAMDQLVFALAGAQVLSGLNGAVTLIVTTNVLVIGTTLTFAGLVLPTIVTMYVLEGVAAVVERNKVVESEDGRVGTLKLVVDRLSEMVGSGGERKSE